jgi:hypothetical protein
MKASDWFKTFEEDSEVLRQIARQYPEDSPQRAALERAALAFAYVVMEHLEGFAAFVTKSASDLTDTQREHLRGLGINVDRRD